MSTTTRTTTARPSARPGGRPIGRQIAGGLGALAVLAVGLVGIPAVLAAFVGWPLPHQFPAGSLVTHALGTSIPDSFWPRLFAVLAWLAWAYFTFSVVTTLVAQLRGHRPNRHPRLIPSGAVAALVAAVMVLGQLRGTAISSSSPPVAALPALQLVAATTPATTAQPTTVTHTVVEGDTLWGIATAYYGDGTRWQAIYQANAGVPQPGGGSLSDAHWIYPGWTLVIPDITQTAPAPPMTPAALPSPAAPAPVVPITTGASHLAITQPPASGGSDAPSSTTPIPIARGVETHSAPDDEPRHTTSRVAAAPPPAAHTTPAIHHAATPSTPAGVHAVNGTHNASVMGNGDDTGTLAMGAGIFGLAAIGLVVALDRRRRRQIGRRSFGGRIPRPEPKGPLADLELQLRHFARAGQTFWLCHLAELLGYAADVAGVTPPGVVGVEIVDHGLGVLVTSDSPEPVAPFAHSPDRPDVWYLPFTTDPGVVDEAATSSPVPLVLASVGQGTAGAVLVNVNRHRSIHIIVAADRVEGILVAMAAELAGTTAPIGTAVIAVGFGYGVVDRLDGGVVVDDLDERTAVARPDEKVIVLVDPQTATDQLLDTVRGRENVHLVTAGPVGPEGTELILDPDHPQLENHGPDPFQPSQVRDDSLEEVQTLFELAEEDPDATAHHGSGPDEVRQPSESAPVGEVMIGLLGDPTISIGDGDLQDLVVAVSQMAETKARRVAELLVYLAAHGGTATRGEWLTDISPDKALSDGYVRNLVLLTRRSLEAITGDPDLLAYDKATQRFSLAERVATDWKQFQSATSIREPVRLRTALGLVRGVPFGVDPDPWTSAGGLSYVIGDAITDASLALGEFALDDGDPRLAAWAARQGQLANRYDQGLWRILLRAAGDDTARQQIWNEFHALLAVDGDPAEDLEPTTLDLYASLSIPRRPASEVVVQQDDDDAVLPTRQAV